MRIMLNVPFAENAKAKRMGCRFSSAEKRWYVDDPQNVELLMRWMPKHLKLPHTEKMARG